MNANLKDLIAALPQDPDDAGSEAEIPQKELIAIFNDLSNRRVPTSSLHRLWTMGELSSQVAFAYLVFWCRQWFSDASEKKQQLAETNLRVALKLIHRLGYLRGAASKFGQLLGALPEILPDQVVQTLDRFHFDAPPMHFSLLREMVRNELGGEPEEIFSHFDKAPFAAASIGQVHRARLKSGENVVVKIQYPGIAKAIDSDLRNISALMLPLRLGKDWDYIRKQFDEIHTMLKLEADYEHEAANMREARELFQSEDGIIVPRVHDAYSSKRVLTSEYIAGMHLGAFLQTNPSQSDRNCFATRIYLAWARMYSSGMNYADPHSGNYLFMTDGRLGLLDFGCVAHWNKEELALMRECERLLDEPERLPQVLRICGADEKLLDKPEYVSLIRDSCDWTEEPFKGSGPFDFSDPDHLKRGVEILSQIALKRYTRSHPMFIYWNRSLIGIRALMYQLGAQIDLRPIFEKNKLNQ